MEQTPAFQTYLGGAPHQDAFKLMGDMHLLWWAITNIYRECLYVFLQRFVYHGQMVLFGSITNPVGCAVAYRRKYIKDLFDRYEPLFGDDLTNSEDIFIGFALNSEGYRNVQLNDVQARSRNRRCSGCRSRCTCGPPPSCRAATTSTTCCAGPLKAPKRTWKRLRDWWSGEAKRIAEMRKIQEAYRSPSATSSPSATAGPSAGCPSSARWRRSACRPR
jgi:hypothetical protein